MKTIFSAIRFKYYRNYKWVCSCGTFTNGNLKWNLIENSLDVIRDSAGYQTNSYYQILKNQWGWTKVDRFYNDPCPKTILKVKLPAGILKTSKHLHQSHKLIRRISSIPLTPIEFEFKKAGCLITTCFLLDGVVITSLFHRSFQQMEM